MNLTSVLKSMRLTEKSNLASSELGQYTFNVSIDSTKPQIAKAVETALKVTVVRVNTATFKGKAKRGRQGLPSTTSDYKKAFVTVKAGDKIDLI